MQVTTRAIVLASLKYGDTSLIVKAFTASDGLKSYMLKGVLASRKGKFKSAYFQPLTQLELVALHRNKGTLEHIKEARINFPYYSLHTHMEKRAMSLFLAEVLLGSIHEEECNQGLFNFLEASFQWLDTHERIVNFHLFFLLELSKYLGFYPDTAASNHKYFDLAAGCFADTPPVTPSLSGRELDDFRAFLGINFDEVEKVRMGRENRKLLLHSILQYFQIHLHGFRSPRSLTVLTEVFS
jgi:DNA repair protein RecO (recombination protein O)